MATAAKRQKKEGPIIVKKYANRRLYDTGRSSYVTLDDLAEMVRENLDFVVQDAKTGEDITHQVLTQIIVDQESRGENLLPVNFLRQLISFYGDNVQQVLPGYLDSFIEILSRNRKQMRENLEQLNSAVGGVIPVSQLDEMNQRNLDMMQQTFRTMMGMPQSEGQDNKKS